MKKRVPTELLNLAIGLLFASNLYFVKRLIDQVDALEAIVWTQKQDIALQAQTIDNIKKCLFKKYGQTIPQARSTYSFR